VSELPGPGEYMPRVRPDFQTIRRGLLLPGRFDFRTVSSRLTLFVRLLEAD
jgi:hypothetical protein